MIRQREHIPHHTPSVLHNSQSEHEIPGLVEGGSRGSLPAKGTYSLVVQGTGTEKIAVGEKLLFRIIEDVISVTLGTEGTGNETHLSLRGQASSGSAKKILSPKIENQGFFGSQGFHLGGGGNPDAGRHEILHQERMFSHEETPFSGNPELYSIISRGRGIGKGVCQGHESLGRKGSYLGEDVSSVRIEDLPFQRKLSGGEKIPVPHEPREIHHLAGAENSPGSEDMSLVPLIEIGPSSEFPIPSPEEIVPEHQIGKILSGGGGDHPGKKIVFPRLFPAEEPQPVLIGGKGSQKLVGPGIDPYYRPFHGASAMQRVHPQKNSFGKDLGGNSQIRKSHHHSRNVPAISGNVRSLENKHPRIGAEELLQIHRHSERLILFGFGAVFPGGSLTGKFQIEPGIIHTQSKRNVVLEHLPRGKPYGFHVHPRQGNPQGTLRGKIASPGSKENIRFHIGKNEGLAEGPGKGGTSKSGKALFESYHHPVSGEKVSVNPKSSASGLQGKLLPGLDLHERGGSGNIHRGGGTYPDASLSFIRRRGVGVLHIQDELGSYHDLLVFGKAEMPYRGGKSPIKRKYRLGFALSLNRDVHGSGGVLLRNTVGKELSSFVPHLQIPPEPYR
jgi:hypothetical protein